MKFSCYDRFLGIEIKGIADSFPPAQGHLGVSSVWEEKWEEFCSGWEVNNLRLRVLQIPAVDDSMYNK